jgi:hypothetical protein
MRRIKVKAIMQIRPGYRFHRLDASEKRTNARSDGAAGVSVAALWIGASLSGLIKDHDPKQPTFAHVCHGPEPPCAADQHGRCLKSVVLAIQKADHGRLRENARLEADRDIRTTACP